VKRKYITSKKDKEDWKKFTKEIGSIFDKDSTFVSENKKTKKFLKLDLHGFGLNEANIKVKKFVNHCYERGCKKILVITGKGIRSKVYEDPYRSKKMSVLKYTVPEFIKKDEDLRQKVRSIAKAEPNDGGDGALYIYLK